MNRFLSSLVEKALFELESSYCLQVAEVRWVGVSGRRGGGQWECWGACRGRLGWVCGSWVGSQSTELAFPGLWSHEEGPVRTRQLLLPGGNRGVLDKVLGFIVAFYI